MHMVPMGSSFLIFHILKLCNEMEMKEVSQKIKQPFIMYFNSYFALWNNTFFVHKFRIFVNSPPKKKFPKWHFPQNLMFLLILIFKAFKDNRKSVRLVGRFYS